MDSTIVHARHRATNLSSPPREGWIYCMRPRKARVMRAPQLPGGSPMKIHQPLADDVRPQVRLTTSGHPRDSPMFPATDRATAGPTATRGPRRIHYDTLHGNKASQSRAIRSHLCACGSSGSRALRRARGAVMYRRTGRRRRQARGSVSSAVSFDDPYDEGESTGGSPHRPPHFQHRDA